MNEDTGHIVTADLLKEMKPEERGSYHILPEEFSRASRVVLKGKREGYVSLTSGGKLSRYASRRRRRRRKTAKASRRRNRK